jgi:hypothetical protein
MLEQPDEGVVREEIKDVYRKTFDAVTYQVPAHLCGVPSS